MLSEINNVNADGCMYKRITIERWFCISCRIAWSETYAVKIPKSGVVSDMFSAYNSNVEVDEMEKSTEDVEVNSLLQQVKDKMRDIG